jgi:predicted RNA binding protein YcfA (HicA-like mRNA interferase family)
MSKAGKLLAKMRNNPRDWNLENVITVCQQNGLDIRAGKGSHHVVSHSSTTTMVTVPAHRPIKPIYIRMLVELIDQVRSL